ncbi:MAG: DUF456 domain-containing protein [Muribaculaceae bacterium]|nr:DUF456 domain-containing protein [Muribaculaceae bacterium]
MSTKQTDSQEALDALNELDQLNHDLHSTDVPAVADAMLPETESNDQNVAPHMSDVEFDGTMSELNKFIGSIYQDMSEINPVFRKASEFCMKRADEWAEAAEKSGKGMDSDEGAVAIAIAGVGIAMNGLGKLLQVWEKQKKINEYKRICANIVKTKGPRIDNMVALAKRAVDEALIDLEEVTGQQIDISYAFSDSYESHLSVKAILMSALNRYRESQYVFDQMVWLRDQIAAWSEGNLEDSSSSYPSYQAINQWIFFTLHPVKDKAAEDARRMEIQETCDYVVDEYIQMVGGAYQIVNSDFLMSLCDNELMATLLNNCSENTKYKLLALYDSVNPQNLSNALEGELSDSTALTVTSKLTRNAENIAIQEKKHTNLMIVNGILLLVMACLPVIVLTDWAWYWKTLVGILISFPIVYRMAKAINTVEEKTKNKIELIERWQHTRILKMTGYKPQPKMITRIQNSIWLTIGCAVIGGIIGSFFLPPIGTILGVCIGALIGGSDNDEEESDGSDWNSFKTGSLSKTITWTVIISLAFLFELYWLFI